MRREIDLLGTVNIDSNSPFGAQTQRTLNLYPTDNTKTLGDYPLFIQSILEIKKACAQTNSLNHELHPTHARAIEQVVEDILQNINPLSKKYFPIHPYHGGGGVGINMNINEVLANLANKQIFHTEFSSYTPIHPNNHINLNNSTSDVLKTAIHITIIKSWDKLKLAISHLKKCIQNFILKYGDTPKISRTCLQDAVEITFGNLFSGYLTSLDRHYQTIQNTIKELHEVNIGGNIIGRRGDCSQKFMDNILTSLRNATSIQDLTHTKNLFEASQNNDLLIQFSSHLSQLSATMIKISKDLRLMASGPEAGFGEIILPAVQQGSSAMPGKINPNIPEYMIQTAFQTIGICHSVSITQTHDELDYSPWQTFIIIQILDSLTLLTESITIFSNHAISDLKPHPTNNQKNLETIIPTMVQLAKTVGYAEASKIYKTTQGNLQEIKRFLKKP